MKEVLYLLPARKQYLPRRAPARTTQSHFFYFMASAQLDDAEPLR